MPPRGYVMVAEYGDPRGGKVDPMTGIQGVPFQETRHTSKVLQNTQIYRARLALNQRPMTADLSRGRPAQLLLLQPGTMDQTPALALHRRTHRAL